MSDQERKAARERREQQQHDAIRAYAHEVAAQAPPLSDSQRQFLRDQFSDRPRTPSIQRATAQPLAVTMQWRTHLNGKLIIEVVNSYAYVWDSSEPINVGDFVLIPAGGVRAALGHGPWTGEVTGIGTTYTGELTAINQKA